MLLASAALLALRAHAQAPATASAREALRAGDLAGARELAEAALAAQPDDADALALLAMIEAKAGDSARALVHFDAALARSGANPPAALLWNRGTCLSALGRPADAEQAFLDAAAHATPPLDALAWLNAGYAALDLGADTRAQQHLQRARALDRAHELGPELADLTAELDTRAQAEHARLYGYLARDELASAERELERARALRPDDAVVWYLSGVASYRQEQRADAQRQLNRARELGLDAARDGLARDYLDLLADGLWLDGRGLHGQLELGGGYDSNAVQAGLADSNPLLAQSASTRGGLYGQARAELSYGVAPSASSFVVARYDLQQTAYAASALDTWNSQQHELAIAGEQQLPDGLRAGALARGTFEAAGLADFRAFSFAGGGELWGALEHAPRARSKLTAAALQTRVVDADYSFLSGTRLDLVLETALGCDALRAGGSAAYRGELIGTQRVDTLAPATSCSDCSARYVIPLGYDGPRAQLWLSYRVAERLRVSARISGELRYHRAPTYLALIAGSGERERLGARHERDARLGVGGGLALELLDPLELDVDYELTVARSNVDNTLGGTHGLDYANLSFVRHVLVLAAAAHF